MQLESVIILTVILHDWHRGTLGLQEHMDKFQRHLDSAKVVIDEFNNETYLDYAEISLKSLLNMGIQKDNGCLRDPFNAHGVTCRGKALELFYYHAEARFCGALGQLIRAGRMTEYADRLYLSYSHLMNLLAYDFEPDYYAEFWVKELVFAYQGLKSIDYPLIDKEIWEKITWHKYGFHYFNNYSNAIAYALASEACMIDTGLGGDENFFDAWSPVLFDGFNRKNGMYNDPGAPMAYDMITKQQILFAIMKGADGENKEEALKLCERGAVSSLFMQSVTGQMPFGGRTNQFLCVEVILAHFFEMMSSLKSKKFENPEACVFKRAAHNAVKSIEPWLNMKPFRHIRQGFSPDLGHGIDSGGVYTVYGLLASSMLGTAYFESLGNENTSCCETPADAGGSVFTTGCDFHKVFATCGGYHIEIDTCADIEKDATGFGRFHKIGIMPETALSGSCASEPTYSYALNEIEPYACAIGPAWLDTNNETVSLAGYDCDKIKSRINVMREDCNGVTFSITYDLCGEQIEETYQLSAEGLLYNIKSDLPGIHITVPLISTDGAAKGVSKITEEGIITKYRGAVYKVICEQPEITGEFCANRNAIYKIARIKDHMVKLQLIANGIEK